MAVSSTVVRNDFTGVSGAGAQTVFAGTFKITAATQVRVVQRVVATGIESVLTNVTDYAITGVGDSTGFTCTLVTALPTTKNLSLLLNVPNTQTTAIRNQGSYYPNLHEDALDYRCRVDQQQQDAIDRSLKQPESETPLNMEMPSVEVRASKYLAFDSSGLPIASSGTVEDSVAVSDFAETILDDTSAGAVRTTIDAQQATASLSEDTAPAVGDRIPFRDISGSDDNYSMLGAIVQGALEARGMWNLGLANATTTNANDSIKIQGAGDALSATNPLYINLPTVSSPGRVTRFSATADVTLRLDTAHWGLGTNGNFTDIILRVYAINDNGTLKWGVSNKGGLRSIADTNTHLYAAATSVSTQPKMLIAGASAISSGTWPCREVGWFLGDFNDTGDLWTVQTGAGEIMVGVPAPVNTDWAADSFTCDFTNTTVTSLSRLVNGVLEVVVQASCTGTPGAGTMLVNFPSGKRIDTSKLNANSLKPVGRCYGNDNGTGQFTGPVIYNATNVVLAQYVKTGATDNDTVGNVTNTAPMTFVVNDYIVSCFTVPLLGWSGN